MRRYLLIVAALIAACPASAANSGGPPTKVAVVYDATSDLVDEIIVPDNDAELTTYLTQTLAIPNGIEVNVSISSINAVGFAAALALIAPAAILPSPGAANVLVNAHIASLE